MRWPKPRVGRVRVAIATGLAAGLAAGMAACGGEEGKFDEYCEEVKVQQEPLKQALAEGEATGLIAALPSFRSLRKVAPDDLEDDWGTVIGRIEDLSAALDDAGVDPADFDPKKPAAGVTDEQQAAVRAAATGLNSPEMRRAFDGVQQQARSVCKTSLTAP